MRYCRGSGCSADEIGATSPQPGGGMKAERNAMNTTMTSTAPGCDDVVVQTLPLFEMMRMRAATTARRHPTPGFAAPNPQSSVRWVKPVHPRTVVCARTTGRSSSPNNDTVYSNAWLDLSDRARRHRDARHGRSLLNPGAAGCLDQPFAYVGRRTTGNRPQRTLVHGPGWHGAVPPGITLTIAAPGDDVWLIGRHLVEDDGEDAARVRASQSAMRLVRSMAATRRCAVDTWIDGRDAGIPAPDLYLSIVDAALRRNPPHPGERLAWPPAVARPGHVAAGRLRTAAHQRPAARPGRRLGDPGHGQDALGRRPRDARPHRAQLHRRAGRRGAMYPTAEVDAHGAPLDGSLRYELRFAPGQGLKVGAFWSLTMYRRSDCLFVANPIHPLFDRRSHARPAPRRRRQPGHPAPGRTIRGRASTGFRRRRTNCSTSSCACTNRMPTTWSFDSTIPPIQPI